LKETTTGGCTSLLRDHTSNKGAVPMLQGTGTGSHQNRTEKHLVQQWQWQWQWKLQSEEQEAGPSGTEEQKWPCICRTLRRSSLKGGRSNVTRLLREGIV
jgi:hypothetical protein